MSKSPKRRHHRPSPRAATAAAAAAPSFTPVPVRPRHDGWTPARQIAFLQILGESACVEEAAAAVGMSARAAYTLKARPDAGSFRQAWDAVLDFSLGRIGDALIGRALHGEVIPHFYGGEQVGEHRRYDNRLAMWLLQVRQPDRYGRWREKLTGSKRTHPDGSAQLMAQAVAHAGDDAQADAAGRPRTPRAPITTEAFADDPALQQAEEELRTRREEARWAADRARWEATLRDRAPDPAAPPTPEQADEEVWDEDDVDAPTAAPNSSPARAEPPKVPAARSGGGVAAEGGGPPRTSAVVEGARFDARPTSGVSPLRHAAAVARHLAVPGRSEEGVTLNTTRGGITPPPPHAPRIS